MANNIRVGTVSSVNYVTGMIRVNYMDKGKAVSVELPYANQNGEYFMPQVGEYVQVSLLSNGSTKGVVTGTYWNKKNKPPESGAGLYRKDFSKTPGAAILRYDDKSGEMLFKAGIVHVNGVDKAKMTAPKTLIESKDKFDFESPVVNISGGDKKKINVNIQAEIINVLAEETSFSEKVKSLELIISETVKMTAKAMEIEAESLKFNISGIDTNFAEIYQNIVNCQERIGISWQKLET